MLFVIAWFVIAAFALTAIGYYLISAKKRRANIRTRGGSDEHRAGFGSLWPRQVTEYVGALAAIMLLGIASAYVVGSYKMRVASQVQATRIMDEQYHEERLTNTLLLSAFNNATIAGTSGRVSSSIIIEVKLQERIVGGRCDRKEFAVAASTATAQLRTPDFHLPDAPAFDDTNIAKCSVKWSWVAIPLHPDTSIAIADVVVKLPNNQIIHASKPIILNVAAPYTGVVASSIGSISVALLSLTGVIFTALMNNRGSRARESAIEQGSATDESVDARDATSGT